MGWKSRANRAKKGHRPRLKDWARDGFYESFPSYADRYVPPDSSASNGTANASPNYNRPSLVPASEHSQNHTHSDAHAVSSSSTTTTATTDQENSIMDQYYNNLALEVDHDDESLILPLNRKRAMQLYIPAFLRQQFYLEHMKHSQRVGKLQSNKHMPKYPDSSDTSSSEDDDDDDDDDDTLGEEENGKTDDGEQINPFQALPGSTQPTKSIPARLNAKYLSQYQFHQQFEANYIPTVISNIPQGFDVPSPPPPPPQSSSKSTTSGNSTKKNNERDEEVEREEEEKKMEDTISSSSTTPTTTVNKWNALERWQLENLKRNVTLKNIKLKCGEDDDGKIIRLRMKHFLKYTEHNKDDSPLYVFEGNFDEDKVAKSLLSDYRVPFYFNEDLFALVGEDRRPPYRWWLIGPKRSGTTVHIDPLATSAWNTLICGKKRWVLFPPHVPRSLVKGYGKSISRTKGEPFIRKGEDDEAIHYFTKILPRIKLAAQQNGGERSGTGKKRNRFENFECYEFTQHEGETVYIPGGWWHAVLNLTDTIGVTQNFCSHRNFDDVWLKTRISRKKMAYKWLCQLDIYYPLLAKRARDMNERDGFVMKYDPEQVKLREEQEKREEEEQQKRKRAKKESKRGKKLM